jgi:hypothetical protein
VALSASALFAQTQDAYEKSGDSTATGKGLLDPSRLTVSHAMSFGMMSGAGTVPLSNMQSSSFYSTMMQYKFTAPVTLNLNFALPIHSSFSKSMNMSSDNMQSMEYFKNMPFDVSLRWQPSERFHFVFSVIKAAGDGYYSSAMDPMRISPYRMRW